MTNEILQNIKSLRFILSMLIVIILFCVSGLFFAGHYHSQLDDYFKITNNNLSDLRGQTDQLYKLAFFEQNVCRQPDVLTLCCEGYESQLPNSFKFNVFDITLPEVKGQTNITLPKFDRIDWVFIINIVLSFVAFVFSYDCFCGERENGTLRLILSSSISRHKILLGKYLGIMLNLGIPLAVGIMINLIIIVVTGDTYIGTSQWLRIAGIIILAVLYLSIFILLGMFVSARTAYASHSMIMLLFIWVVLVILVPGLGRIIADIKYRDVNATELNRKLKETNDLINQNALAGRYGDNATSYSWRLEDPINNPSARKRYLDALVEAENQVYYSHHNNMLAQVIEGRSFTCMSPSVIFQRASEIIAGTGINRCGDLFEQINRYRKELNEFITTRDQQDLSSIHLIFKDQNAIRDWGIISKKPADFDTVPKFQERKLALGESLQLAIWDIGLLALFNLAFFTASFVSFLRYDVR